MVDRNDAHSPSGAEHRRTAAAPTADDLFAALADATRRQVLWYLRAERETTVADLVDVLVGWRLGDADVVDAAERARIAVSLHHVHLPRLADAGLVEWETDADAVVLADVPASVSDLIRDAHEYERAAGAESE